MNHAAANPPVEVILLAAGASRRMGGADKLLLRLAAGEPMVRTAARLYADLGLPLTVVLRDAEGPVAAALAGIRASIAINHQPPTPSDDGLQASMHAGLGATPLTAPGVLIALADQPRLTAADIAALIAAFQTAGGAAIIIPRHHGRRGNPVIIPAAIARHLRHAGISARAYIDAHPERVDWYDTPDDHFTHDIDTPQDLAEYGAFT